MITKKKIITGTLIILILLLTISTSQAGTFTDLNNNITAAIGTLDLTDDYNNTDNKDITINKNIVINGQGHIIDLNGQSNHHIVITNGFTVTLNNITLINGNYHEDGGAIWNNGTLTITNSTFTNNNAGEKGGAIKNYGNLNITSSTFTRNTAKEYGGAIHTEDSNITITDSTFNHNHVTRGDGNSDGGAIYNYEHSNLNIINSTFNNNTAKTGGGAIKNNEGNLNIIDSTFTNNNATNGGAIVNNANLTISNSTFNNNNATIGGAIYNSNNITINNSTFTNNTAKICGGAIWNQANITINNSTFNHNNATNGGAIYNNYQNINIIDSTFNYNTATWGGAIYNTRSSYININNSTFKYNTVNQWGGAIYNIGNLNITGSIFTNNTAVNNGTIILSIDGDVNISQSILADNNAKYTAYKYSGTFIADGNYWGNLNPTADNLTNGVVVEDYYRFLLTGVNSTLVGNEITLTLGEIVLNTTNAPWTGPALNMSATFSSNPNTATLTPTGDTVKFKASTAGSYTVTANKAGGNSTITITVKNPTPPINTIIMSKITPVYEGYTLKIVVTLKSGTTPLKYKTVKFTGYRGKTYTRNTNTKGQAILYIKNAVRGTYKIKAQYTTLYTTGKANVKPLAISKSTPRKNQKGYSQTRTFIITFNQKIKKSTKYTKIYVKNLNTKRRVGITTKIIGNKLYIKMKAKRYKKHYYRIYIPRYSIINSKKKTITKNTYIKFRT